MAYFPEKGSALHSQLLQAMSQTDDLVLIKRELMMFLVKTILYYSEFDVDYYVEQNLDLKQLIDDTDCFDALHHFLNHGIFEGREFSLTCDNKYYIAQNPDIVPEFGEDSSSHFRSHGRYEGRAGTEAQLKHVQRIAEL